MENINPPPFPNTSETENTIDDMIQNLQKKLEDDMNKPNSSTPSLASQINLSSIVNNSFGVILGSIFVIYVLYFITKNKTFINSVSEF